MSLVRSAMLLTALLLLAPQAHADHARRGRPLRDALQAQLDRVEAIGHKIRHLAARDLGPRQRRRLAELGAELAEHTLRIEEIHRAIVDRVRTRTEEERCARRLALIRPIPQPRPIPVPRRPARTPMSPSNFKALSRVVEESAMEDEKLAVIRDAVGGGAWFTVSQATDLLERMSFDDRRVKAAVALCPRILDANALFKILPVFDFDSSRQELREAVGGVCGIQP